MEPDSSNPRVKPQAEKQSNLELYKRIFDLLPASVFIKDRNNQLLEFNEAFRELMRISREE